VSESARGVTRVLLMSRTIPQNTTEEMDEIFELISYSRTILMCF